MAMALAKLHVCNPVGARPPPPSVASGGYDPLFGVPTRLPAPLRARSCSAAARASVLSAPAFLYPSAQVRVFPSAWVPLTVAHPRCVGGDVPGCVCGTVCVCVCGTVCVCVCGTVCVCSACRPPSHTLAMSSSIRRGQLSMFSPASPVRAGPPMPCSSIAPASDSSVAPYVPVSVSSLVL